MDRNRSQIQILTLVFKYEKKENMMRKEKMMMADYGLKTKKQEILIIDKGYHVRICCAAALMDLI